METETYKMAKIILERFDPDSTHIKKREKTMDFEEKIKPLEVGTDCHQRPLASCQGRPWVSRSPCGSISQAKLPLQRDSSTRSPAPPHTASNTAAVSRADFHPPGPPRPRPTAPRGQGWIIKILEYLIGVGFRNRSALICRHCYCHNGMALREEFEYMAFRCAYCFVLNAAKKTRCRGCQPVMGSGQTPHSLDWGPRREAKPQEIVGQSDPKDNTSAVKVPSDEVREDGITGRVEPQPKTAKTGAGEGAEQSQEGVEQSQEGVNAKAPETTVPESPP
ncbi:endoplasmic reticulum junction formation protein lunapark-like [Callorhinchus milii]|uniref:endoplasmic reticulum junction formation protein lunapark-like n=1 Tax=Callorhinchus milii TaxID=7868 RepID=UPI001C3FAF98|nr:endoplasmic reticulum junction formation protein lunapark-like [Callorhinchus milii]